MLIAPTLDSYNIFEELAEYVKSFKKNVTWQKIEHTKSIKIDK